MLRNITKRRNKTIVAVLAVLVIAAVMVGRVFSDTGEETMPDRIVIAFQRQADPRQIQENANELARILTDELGIPVQVLVPTSYGASVQALVSNRAQVAYLSSIPYLLAKEEAPVELLLAEVRDERTDYDSIFVVAKDSPYETLEDTRGERMMWTSPTSASGYVFPYSRMVRDGLLQKEQNPADFFGQVSYAGSYDRALSAVLRGQADVCAVSYYTMEGDRTAMYISDEDREKLRVLDRTPGVPTHLLCARTDLPQALRTQLREALLAISEERPELLADVYGAASFKKVPEEEHIKTAVEALENTGLAAGRLVR